MHEAICAKWPFITKLCRFYSITLNPASDSGSPWFDRPSKKVTLEGMMFPITFPHRHPYFSIRLCSTFEIALFNRYNRDLCFVSPIHPKLILLIDSSNFHLILYGCAIYNNIQPLLVYDPFLAEDFPRQDHGSTLLFLNISKEKCIVDK